jgi:peptidoglycan/LPS O-acetylase OafA/YrhL
MLLAPHVGRLGGRAGLVALAAVAPCIAVQEIPSAGVLPSFADRLMELPLTVALLVAMRPLGQIPPLAHGLGWLGQNSYGLYVGQMLAHDGFTFWFGLPRLYQLWNPWLYAFALLAIAVALRAAAEGALTLAARWRGVSLAMAAPAD